MATTCIYDPFITQDKELQKYPMSFYDEYILMCADIFAVWITYYFNFAARDHNPDLPWRPKSKASEINDVHVSIGPATRLYISEKKRVIIDLV